MTKLLGKYFIAFVPTGDIQQEATKRKVLLNENYGIRYGLRSPAHVTLKMPFLWNEKKELDLRRRLTVFFERKMPFEIRFNGLGTFGRRVIFIRVKQNEQLNLLQKDLIGYCKTSLKLDIELSDSVYTAHMTLALKDLRDKDFEAYLRSLSQLPFESRCMVTEVAMLKKNGGKWQVCDTFPLASQLSVDQG